MALSVRIASSQRRSTSGSVGGWALHLRRTDSLLTGGNIIAESAVDLSERNKTPPASENVSGKGAAGGIGVA